MTCLPLSGIEKSPGGQQQLYKLQLRPRNTLRQDSRQAVLCSQGHDQHGHLQELHVAHQPPSRGWQQAVRSSCCLQSHSCLQIGQLLRQSIAMVAEAEAVPSGPDL